MCPNKTRKNPINLLQKFQWNLDRKDLEQMKKSWKYQHFNNITSPKIRSSGLYYTLPAGF